MKRHLISAMTLTVGLLIAGCGGSPTASNTAGGGAGQTPAEQVYAQINGLSGEERTNTLTDLAKKENALSLYTSNTDMDGIVKAFEDKYGIQVESYRANSETILQRVLQESSANYQGADIIETNAGELNALDQQKLLAPYEGELRSKVRPEGRKDNWTADRFNAFVIGWNTQKVAPADAPKTLADLADPKWKGRISLEIGDVDWFAAMYQYYQGQGMTDDAVMDLFKRIAANAKIAKGHTVMGELLSAGQFDVAASIYSHTVENAAADGAPVAWIRPDGKPAQPVVLRPNGAGLLKTAKNPAVAMLFMDFLLTDGQKQIEDANRMGSVPTANDPLAGVAVVSPPEEELLNNSHKWNDLYAQIVQGGEQS
jgi:iron(III) transport system substrate-binding protein